MFPIKKKGRAAMNQSTMHKANFYAYYYFTK